MPNSVLGTEVGYKDTDRLQETSLLVRQLVTELNSK